MTALSTCGRLSGRRLLAIVLAEGRLDLTLLDACRWFAALAEALLLGAITHHAGMGNIALVLRGLGFLELVRHHDLPGLRSMSRPNRTVNLVQSFASPRSIRNSPPICLTKDETSFIPSPSRAAGSNPAGRAGPLLQTDRA